MSGEGFLGRWSRLKKEITADSPAGEILDGELEVNAITTAIEVAPTDGIEVEAEPVELTDEDMPALETLTADSDYSGFLSPKVSEELRKMALRKLFGLPMFNVRDGLDDYDDDFTKFEALGDIIPAEMKYRMEKEAERLLADAEAAEDDGIEEIDDLDSVEEILNDEEPADDFAPELDSISDDAPLPVEFQADTLLPPGQKEHNQPTGMNS